MTSDQHTPDRMAMIGTPAMYQLLYMQFEDMAERLSEAPEELLGILAAHYGYEIIPWTGEENHNG